MTVQSEERPRARKLATDRVSSSGSGPTVAPIVSGSMPLPGLARGRNPGPGPSEGASTQAPDVVTSVAPVRTRPALQPQAILKAVYSSSYLKQVLKRQTHVQQRGPGTETMAERVGLVLAEVDGMFGKEPEAEAMALAVALDKVATVIADELYDPRLRSAIAKDLFAVYGPKLEAALTKAKVADPAATVALGEVLASSDPVSQFMHGEIRMDEAARQVHDAATAANRPPLEMLQLLRTRFEAEMASYQRATVSEQQHQAEAYNLSESPGELSTAYLDRLFGHGNGPRKDAGGRLVFSGESTAQLDALASQVKAGRPAAPPGTPDGRRKAMFDEVQTDDDRVRDMRERHVIAALTSDWQLSPETAQKVVDRLKAPNGLASVPLTITHWAARRSKLGPGNEIDTVDQSRAGATNSQQMSEVIGVRGTKAKQSLGGQTRATAGRYDDPYGGDRGDRYLQFRTWKDARMTGNLGMTPEEMPVFGALNTTFDKYGGTEGPATGPLDASILALENRQKSGGLSKQEKQALATMKAEHQRLVDTSLDPDLMYGLNYYGDMHLKLKRDRVKDRVLYTASDHGRPHRDPFLAFADMLVGTVTEGTQTYHSDLTGLKRKGGKGVKAEAKAAAMVATILGTQAVAHMGLPFEIMIFGGVDWETDVEEIWVAPSAPADAFKRLQDWSKAKGPGGLVRPPVRRMKRPVGVTVKPSGGLMKDAKADAAAL